jgi:hypothetical protein
MGTDSRKSGTVTEINLYSGTVFDPFNPCPDLIKVEDIAHSLSMLCRFNGHCRSFYSVAEHSVRVAEKCGEDLMLVGLLHDAAEAYLGDLPRPIKEVLPDFLAAERRLQVAISRRFGLPREMPDDVRLVDEEMLRIELAELVLPHPSSARNFSGCLACWAPEKAKVEFLRLYDQVRSESRSSPAMRVSYDTGI